MFSSIEEVWNRDPVIEMTKKINRGDFLEKELSFSDIFSEKEKSVSIINKSKNKELNSDNNYDCSFSIKHLKKCKKCYNSLKKLILLKMDENIDDIFLDIKLNKIRDSDLVMSNLDSKTDNIKEIFYITLGSIIILFLILFLAKYLIKF